MTDVDMSPRAVERRLREVSRQRREQLERQGPVDMSPEGVEGRLRAVSRLRGLCLRLGEWEEGASSPT
jgi:hypothetical protein